MFRSRYPDVVIPRTSLIELVLGRAGGRRDVPALVDGLTGRTLTYGQLLDQVRGAAAGLAALGVRKGSVVLLTAPNSPEFAVAFYAIVRLGAIVTPANPANTSSEIAHQIADAGAMLAIAPAALADKVRAAIAEAGKPLSIVTLDEAPGLPSLASIARDADPPEVSIDPEVDVVALPYSSGTTGLPKGVMLTHRNLVANVTQVDAVETDPFRVLVGVLPFFHIYAMSVILSVGLMRGATIVTLARFELEAFLKVLEDWRIEIAHVVPPIVVALAKHPSVDNYDLRSLRCLFSGAASLGAELTDAVRTRLGVSTRQGYGLTETSPAVHYTAPGTERPGKAGLLMPNTECRVVDPETGGDRGAGEPGELWLRGPQVMKGYLNNPEATARTVDADGWLHTGDICTMDAEGYLTVVDRLKELINVKGFQVAPAELEALLLKHPQVADVAVIPVPDDDAGEVPKAVIVPRTGLTADDVIAFVRAQVAHYKRVQHVEFVDAIPKSPSGKILRRVLVERERARAASSGARTS